MADGKEIELRSEEVQEVMGQMPSWILRWGVTIIFVVVVGILVACCFFKYPDVITAEMTLTSRNPVVGVVAHASGKIDQLYISDGQEVKAGAPLAVIENTANTDDVFRLKKLLAGYMDQPERLDYFLTKDVCQLGDIQPTYMALSAKDVGARDYRAAIGQLLAAIRRWEMDFCLISPEAGKVQLLQQAYPNQHMNSGETFCWIVPDKRGEWIGRAQLPVLGSGKVKVGQRVIVRFSNYPDQEFGIVNGMLSSVSLVPLENDYMVEISFPDGMISNYGKKLPVSHEMKATAEIVTEDLRLIERLFFPLKKMLKEAL